MHVLILNYNRLHTTFLKKALHYENIGADTCLPQNIEAIWYGQYDAVIAALEAWTTKTLQEIKELFQNLGTIPIVLTARGAPPPFLQTELKEIPHVTAIGTHLPFHHFLIALKSLVEKNRGEKQNFKLMVGDVHIDIEGREATRNKKHLSLRHREFDLLTCFMQNPNRVLTRTYLIDNVWDHNLRMESNTVDVHIARLRRKLDDPFEQKYIQTITHIGYKLAIPT